ncbi:hypothetical protein BCV70DRAFT_50218 [Testicularia cyperi]|uniref:Uncharacterized protein n=1 Tax=Testicularia cyperi TaxID=1882483 RepID=A0A317XH27_9BASI|nr:hypothetical protein BCV70DRAFT_50218 [Testicularia cyperi]
MFACEWMVVPRWRRCVGKRPRLSFADDDEKKECRKPICETGDGVEAQKSNNRIAGDVTEDRGATLTTLQLLSHYSRTRLGCCGTVLVTMPCLALESLSPCVASKRRNKASAECRTVALLSNPLNAFWPFIGQSTI